MEKVIVIGGKGSAVVLAEHIIDARKKGSDVEFIGFAFDDPAYQEINGFPVLCKTFEAYDKYRKYDDIKFIFQLYRPDLIRERIALRDSYGIPLDRYATFIHPSAVVTESASLGHGTAVLANAVVNSNAKVGNHVTLQSGVLIGHDTVVGDSSFFAAQSLVGSNDSIGEGCFIGLNSSINNYIEIGDFVFVGMSSNVIKSVSTDAMVYGNPARQVEKRIKPL